MKYPRQAVDRLRRGMAFLLAMVLLLGLAPVYLPTAQAAEEEEETWVQGYLDKLVDWGIMRGDQEGNLDPDREITRAEFVSMINRAYNYRMVGLTPFTDVELRSWYYDDIGIAYLAGYFYGSSATTASPESTMTREEAAVILARNMMLREEPGEPVDFTDTRELSDWSRSIISSAAESGVIKGYPDGSFRPQQNITRGEVASMLVNAIGTYINEEGDYSLGGVYGNLSISSPGVILRDTTVAGDLYLTSGVGLGDVTLENVTVLGKIVASGAGESHEGDCSIILRNVTSDEMVVDSAANQFVTIRAEGDTNIGLTSVRTHGYIEDATPIGLGLKRIELDGESGITLELVGNINEAVNLTPMSTMSLNKGSAEVLTVDELAAGSTLNILNGAGAKKVNLDTGTQVTGNGDIADIQINAAGSNVAMLPDKIVIRPGLSGDIAGETMDTVAAQESSQDPKILAGYPAVRNISPKEADAVFSTNKRATLYWAVSAVADGSVSADDLISPPAYGGQILQKGTLPIDSSKKEVTAKITGLTSDGTYYLSAVIVDNRGLRSPVKVASFTTPDDSVPAFAEGYPTMSKITGDSAQVTVMPTKSCQLFYALLPQNAAAPKPQDFKANAVTGNLGYGSLDVVKNTTSTFYVNSQLLEELKTYDLYLWLTDYNGVKSSEVKKISFSTVDVTPPVVLHMDETKMQATSIEMTYAVNEPSDLYWVVVKEGEDYPKPLTGQTAKPDLASDAAKLQVENGMNGLKNGNSKASKADTDVKFTISGLEAQTAYDLYYVAKDAAGNHSAAVQKLTIYTLDNQPPDVSQEFTRFNGDVKDVPLPNTDVRLVFTESVQGIDTVQGERVYERFLDLYQKVVKSTGQDKIDAQDALADVLRKHIELYTVVGGQSSLVTERDKNWTAASGPWVIDYRNATVTMENGKMIVTFVTDNRNNKANSALNLASGGTYYFRCTGIADTSTAANLMGNKDLPRFTTIFAQLNLIDGAIDVPTGDVRTDMSFRINPTSTSSVTEDIFYDVFLWSNTTIKYKLYGRVIDERNQKVTTNTQLSILKDVTSTPDSKGWFYLGEDTITSNGAMVGRSVNRLINKTAGISTPTFPQLNTMKEGWTYEFAISLTQVGTLDEMESWSDEVVINVTIPAGNENNISNLSTVITQSIWDDALKKGVTSIGFPNDFSVSRRFSDTTVPKFTSGYPKFTPGDSFVTIDFQVNRPGTVYYVLAPMAKLTKDENGVVTGYNWSPAITTEDEKGVELKPQIPKYPIDGVPGNTNLATQYFPPNIGASESSIVENPENSSYYPTLRIPIDLNIYQPSYSSSRIKTGSIDLEYGVDDVTIGLNNDALEAETVYYAYCVLKGVSQNLSKVYCFQFTTTKVEKPAIILNENSPNVDATTTTPAVMHWVLYANDSLFAILKQPFATTGGTTTDGSSYLAHVDSTKAADYDNKKSTLFPGNDKPTVLDALLTSMPGNNYSVFDEYANQAVRDEVLGRIMGTITGGVEYAGREQDLPMDQNRLKSYECTKYMTPNTQYYFIAAARNAQGTEYSFKAVGNVHIPDKEPPVFQTVSTDAISAYDHSGNRVDYIDWQNNPLSYTYNTEITLYFNERIYLLIDQGNNNKQLVEINKSNIEQHLLMPGTVGINDDKTIVGDGTIRLSLSKLEQGNTITLFRDGSIADAYSNSNAQGARLQLKFNVMNSVPDPIEGDPDHVRYEPTFTYEWIK
ncbi:MAG: S-layer homology domain-containing protein [Oscillospiraceae bacterium]|nr:S-layer homology domain-containing protein [Oscillospiraceae bacterium]